MKNIIEFIKNFDFSVFSLDFLDLLIAFGIIILIFVIGNKLISFLRPETARVTRHILTITFYCTFFSLQLFIVMNAILTKNYDRLQLMIIVAVLPCLSYLIGKLYKRYDKLVDRFTK
jgi:hypothetical protein